MLNASVFLSTVMFNWVRNYFFKGDLLKSLYPITFIFWVVWIAVLDNNNIYVVLSNKMKMHELEREREILLEKIVNVKRERNEVSGNPKLLEKWAREKYMMRKPNEDVYIIVDENNNLFESSQN